MKTYLVFSDSHGQEAVLREVLQREKGYDGVLHLGDLQRNGEEFRRILQEYAVLPAFKAVRGNCDDDPELPSETVFSVFGVRIFLTHGHLHRVHRGTELLAAAAREQGCGYALFGHIHRPVEEERDGVILLNPGSISLPRQGNALYSYGILRVTGEGKVTWEQKYLSRTI